MNISKWTHRMGLVLFLLVMFNNIQPTRDWNNFYAVGLGIVLFVFWGD